MDWRNIDFDWNRARAFLAVVEMGSLSAAGRALHTSQPTLGRQISALEAELNIILFERVGRGLVLTDSGHRLYQYVKKMAEAASELSLAALGQNEEVSGEVCISLSELDAFFRLPECIEKLTQQAPNIRLEVIVSNQISDLMRREADIAIRYQRPTEADLIVKKLGQEKVFVYGHRQYAAHWQSASSQAIKALKIIGFDHSDAMKHFLQKQNWPIEDHQFIILCKNQMVQWQLLLQGVGVAFLPDHVAARHPDLIPIFQDKYEPMTLEMWLVCHRELHTNRKIRVVFDWLVENFSSYNKPKAHGRAD